jgi:DNA-binding response OmpR family regulator
MSKLEHSTNACVLVVDDHAALRHMLRVALEAAGLEVSEAATASEAIDSIEARQPHALILSLQRADQQGLDLLDRLRARQDLDRVPIVFLAGEDADLTRWRALLAGADWYATRPLSLCELRRRVLHLAQAGRPRLRIVASQARMARLAG